MPMNSSSSECLRISGSSWQVRHFFVSLCLRRHAGTGKPSLQKEENTLAPGRKKKDFSPDFNRLTRSARSEIIVLPLIFSGPAGPGALKKGKETEQETEKKAVR